MIRTLRCMRWQENRTWPGFFKVPSQQTKCIFKVPQTHVWKSQASKQNEKWSFKILKLIFVKYSIILTEMKKKQNKTGRNLTTHFKSPSGQPCAEPCSSLECKEKHDGNVRLWEVEAMWTANCTAFKHQGKLKQTHWFFWLNRWAKNYF